MQVTSLRQYTKLRTPQLNRTYLQIISSVPFLDNQRKQTGWETINLLSQIFIFKLFYLFANLRTIPFLGGPPESLPEPGPWSVTSLTVHSFFSLLASEAGLARGEHMGLPGEDAAGEAGNEEAGVGSGVGSLSAVKSVSDSGKFLSGHGGTGGQSSSSKTDFSDLSVEEDLRCASLESESER